MHTQNIYLVVIGIALGIIYLLWHCSQFNEKDICDRDGYTGHISDDGPGLNYAADVQQYILEIHQI